MRLEGFSATMRRALTAADAIMNSSVPISTMRASTACFFSRLGPNRTMALKIARARRREDRSTNLMWVAMGPKAP